MSSQAGLVPALSSWFQPEDLHSAPRDFGARLVRQPPRCIDTSASVFPVCDGESCPLQHYLVSKAGRDSRKAHQDLDRLKFGLQIAKTNIKRVMGALSELRTIPEGYRNYRDIANFNLNNLNERLIDRFPDQRFDKDVASEKDLSAWGKKYFGRWQMGGPTIHPSADWMNPKRHQPGYRQNIDVNPRFGDSTLYGNPGFI